MQKARLLAVKNSCPVYIDFDFNNDGNIDNTYTIWKDLNNSNAYDDATSDNNGDGTIDSSDEELIETIPLPNAISFGSVAVSDGGPTVVSKITYGSDQLKFSPRGTSSSGNAYLHVPNKVSAGTYAVGTNNIGRVRSQYYATDGGAWR
jgi:Tfp pilus assembly protein FimT